RELIRRILSDIQPLSDRLLDLSGQTNLLELKALFETVDVVVGSDSLPLHLAGAVGRARLIGLYGPTSPVRTPPPAVHGQATLLSTQLDCQPCDQRNCPLKTDACMQQLSPDMVFAALQQAMTECGGCAPNPQS